MRRLQPVAFDIETDGLSPSSAITVAGLAHQYGVILLLNTQRRTANQLTLESAMTEYSKAKVDLTVCETEEALIKELQEIGANTLTPDVHYLTAYNGETWQGGFDLPFLRTSCVKSNLEWPFPEIAYADIFEVVDRFNTSDKNDLVGVYDELIGRDSCDPFEDSGAAVDAFESGDWEALCLHNLADIQRTLELATLAGRYVAKSDFKMKNLSPPDS